MNTSRLDRLSEYLETASSLSGQERAAYVARVCGDDDELRSELESLLKASDSFGGFLEHPLTCAAENPTAADLLPAGTLLGHWRVLRLIGRGGMGEVYDAERAAGDFEQRVAIKVTRRESAAQLERFNVERQLLAQLEHPGIARLLDGGTAPDGRPYFVMEYIDGQPLTEYCDAVRADLAQRLALFLQVCDAVAYAHRHLIVHRDIKPGNVLVDREGRVRLLDFGIAKPLDDGLQQPPGDGGMTLPFLTPDYAAPEQLAGEPVTTATDVHALGVLLFELLSGRRPWAASEQPLLALAIHTVLERPAPRCSAVASETDERPIPPRALRGDLDAIIAKCLRREPQHRYATVEALKLDIERSQRGDTVSARGDARLYVLGRVARRYRWAVASVAAIIVILAAGVAATTWQAKRAEREAARATATKDFLIGVFKASDPRIAQDKPRGEITARELLDASVSRIDREFASDPEVQIELLGVASAIYRELGEDKRYDELHRRHLDMARAQYGDEHPIVLAALLDDAQRAYVQIENARALQILESLDPMIRRAGLDSTAIRARWWLIRGQALLAESSKLDEQVKALRTAADLYARVAPTDPDRVTALADLGTAYNNQMDFTSSRKYYEEAIAVSETVRDRNDGELATIYGNLGLLSFNLGDFAAADRAYARSAEIIRRTYGEEHHEHWVRTANWARAAHLSGDRERADQIFGELLKHIPPDSTHNDAFEAREWYAGCLASEGRLLDAIPLLEASERHYRTQSRVDFQLARIRLTLGDAYDRAGEPDKAREMLHAALQFRVANTPPDAQVVLALRERWGRFLLGQGDLAGAEAEFQEVVRQARGRTLSHIALAHGGIARLALARGDLEQARAASEAALHIWEHVTGFRDVRMGPYLWLIHSEVLRRSGDLTGARTWAKQALDARRRYDHPSSASIAEAEVALQAAGS